MHTVVYIYLDISPTWFQHTSKHTLRTAVLSWHGIWTWVVWLAAQRWSSIRQKGTPEAGLQAIFHWTLDHQRATVPPECIFIWSLTPGFVWLLLFNYQWPTDWLHRRQHNNNGFCHEANHIFICNIDKQYIMIWSHNVTTSFQINTLSNIT